MNEFWTMISENALDIILSIVGAILVLIIGFKLINGLSKLLSKAKGFKGLDASVRTFIHSFISITLRVIVIVTAASILGVPLTAIVTILGSAGLAVGLSLQGSLSNFAGGIMILIFKPFKVGDFIDTHSDTGTVISISVFYTTLSTPDNRIIIIPNGSLSNTAIINYSVMPTRRADFEFSTVYNADVDHVINVIKSTVDANPLVHKDPAPLVRLLKQDKNTLIFTLRVWCNAADFATLNFDINESIKRTFDQNGIAAPLAPIAAVVKPV